MAGKFINTKRIDYMNDLVEGFKKRLVNGYYLNIDQKATICTYYNINKEYSTLDEGLQIAYANLGENSPLKFNQIDNFFIYGIEKITTELETGEFGIQSSEITGDGIILPNTIVPIPGDYFKINYLKQIYLFRVLSVTSDTLESGANFFRITYQYDSDNDRSLLPLIINNYETLINNIGTELKTIILKDDYNKIEQIEEITNNLKKYYKHLFYSDRVQTFICQNKSTLIYDPYVVEFIIRNKLLDGIEEEYIYITQQMSLHKTFSIDYDQSFFRYIEKKKKLDCLKLRYGRLDIIKQPLSILSSRQEDYWYIYDYGSQTIDSIEIFDQELYNLIDSNTLLEFDIVYNIIIKYFNNTEITLVDIDQLLDIKYDKSPKLFYYLPIVIYILEHNIKNLLFKEEINK